LASKKTKANWVVPVLIMTGLLVGMYFINRFQNPPEAAPPPPPPPPASATKPGGPPQRPVGVGGFTAAPPELSINDPSKAATRIQVGWEYDAGVQSNPAILSQVIAMLSEMAQASNGKVSLVVADLDLPGSDLSPASKAIPGLGIYVNGKPTVSMNGRSFDLSGNLGSGTLVPQALGPIMSGFFAHQ